MVDCYDKTTKALVIGGGGHYHAVSSWQLTIKWPRSYTTNRVATLIRTIGSDSPVKQNKTKQNQTAGKQQELSIFEKSKTF